MSKKKEKDVAIPSNSDVVKQRFGHLIPYQFVEIPKEHRYKKDAVHSLRCFKKIYQRDSDRKQDKSLPKRRCRKHVVEGYLYCSKHGGKVNLPVKLKTEDQSIAHIYKKVYDAEMGDLLESFLNDPKLLDLKPDLANLRVILNNYIKKLLEPAKYGTIKNFMQQTREILIEEEKTDEWKYNKIVELVESQNSIHSGKAIDRINRCVENIGKQIERIHKYETKDDFLLTPDGIKILLRAMVELLDVNIPDENLKKLIRDGLLKLSVETKGDITKYEHYHKEQSIDAELVE